jgi:hypothetical protein
MTILPHVNSTSLQIRNVEVLGAIGSAGPEHRSVLRTHDPRHSNEQDDFDLSIRTEPEPLIQRWQEFHRIVAKLSGNTHVCIFLPESTDKHKILFWGE